MWQQSNGKKEHQEEMRAYRRLHYRKNKQQYFDRLKLRETVSRQFVNELKKASKCSRCFETDWRCLDFHHINPNEKTISISQIYRLGWSIERIKSEIIKCELICANCHRKEHISAE